MGSAPGGGPHHHHGAASSGQDPAGSSSHKSVATSPINPQHDGSHPLSAGGASGGGIGGGGGGIGPDGKRSLPKGAHVRFSEVEGGSATSTAQSMRLASSQFRLSWFTDFLFSGQGTATSTPSAAPHPGSASSTAATSASSTEASQAAVSNTATTTIVTSTSNGVISATRSTTIHTILEPSEVISEDFQESSESETDNNDDVETARKFLLLVDQLSLDQSHHLTIKDIGIILERLSGKIVDVERLDREVEGSDCHNWTIRATIRGEAMRELGVIYNSNYYSISEHPGYQRSLGDDDDDEDEDDDDVEEDEEEGGKNGTIEKKRPSQ